MPKNKENPTGNSKSTSFHTPPIRKLAAILFTDMEGYTALMAKDEALASRLRQRHRQVLHDCHQLHRGEVVNYFGDGTLSIFPSAVEAVRCAIDMQRAFQEDPKVPLRIGIHLGEVVRDKEGLYGNSVNIASRLESFATAGSILVSAKITEELANQLDFSFRSLGLFELKNVPKPMEVFAVYNEEIEIPKLKDLQGKGKRLDGNAPRYTTRLENFVGRGKELNLLRKAWKETQAYKGTMIGIAGEPGIGKTTLTEDFLSELSEAHQSLTVARGQCSERLAGTEAFLPFLEILEELIREESNSAMLRQLAPAWYVQLRPYSVEESKTLEFATQATQERRKMEMAAFLESIAMRNPLVIFIDDMHWADNASVDLLAYLAPRFSRFSSLLLLTYRPGDMKRVEHPFLKLKSELQSKRLYREIRLGFLSEDNIAAYLSLEFPGHQFPKEFAHAILVRTEGNPLFMSDLVSHLQDKGMIDQFNGRWNLTKPITVIESELPESIGGMIERKLQQLSKDDRQCLQIAAVQGYEFDSAVIALQLSINLWEAEEKLDGLANNNRLIKKLRELELPDGTVSLRYGFVHVLYQNALYASLSVNKKIHLCAQVAAFLLQLYNSEAETIASELAALYEASRNWEQAIRFYLQAAQQAAGKSAYKETITLGQKGLKVLKSLPEIPENLQREMELLLVTGPAKSMTYGWGNEKVLADYERCYSLSQRLGDIAALFPASNGLLMNYSFQGNLPKALEIGQEALEIALEKNDPFPLPYAFLQYGSVLSWMGDHIAAVSYYEKGLSHYDPQIHTQLILKYHMDARESCLSFSGWSTCNMGFPDSGLAKAKAAVEWAEQIEHPSSLSEALTFLAWVHTVRREFAESERRARVLIHLAEEHGYPLRITVGKSLLGLALVRKGKIKEGLQEAKRGLDVMRRIGTSFLMTVHIGAWTQACLLAGYQKDGLEAVKEGLTITEQTGERVYDEELYRLKGELLLINNSNYEEAEKCFLKSIELAQSRETKWWELRATVSLIRLWQQQGKHREAYHKLKAIYDWFTEGFDTVDMKEAKSLLTELEKSIDEQHAAPTIAVLPFKDLSPKKDQEYFCDGLADEVITDLSGIKHITVISNNSSFQLKGMSLDTQEISRKLRVRYLLAGSVRKAGKRLRITAQLIDAEADHQIWADKFNGTLEDVFDLQEEISRCIVHCLNLKLSPKEEQHLVERPIEDVRAYDVYLQAHREIWLLSEASLDRAVQLIDKALEMIGTNALLLATKGHIHLRYIMLGIRPDRIHLEEAGKCLDQLKHLKPDSLDRYLLQGMIRYKQADIQQATNDFKQALQYNPNNRDALFFLTVMYILSGHGQAAKPFVDRLIAVDPLNAVSHCMPGYVMACQGDFEGAVPYYRKMYEMDPDNPFIIFAFCVIPARALPSKDLIPLLLKLEPLVPHLTFARHARFLRLALEGKKGEAMLAGANEQLQKEAQWDEHASWWLACTYAILNEKELAIDWLENAIRHGYFNYPFFSSIDPFLENLRNESRFQQLMEKTKRKWEHFEV